MDAADDAAYAAPALPGWLPDPAAPPATPELASYIAAGGRLVVGATMFVFGTARLAVRAGCGPARSELTLGTLVGPAKDVVAVLARLGDATNAPGNTVLLLPLGCAAWLALHRCTATTVGFGAVTGEMRVVQDLGLVAAGLPAGLADPVVR